MTAVYDRKIVQSKARGHWDSIFDTLVPELSEALNNKGKHVICPFHGGKTDFRIDKNSKEGRCFCTCRHFKDGFTIIAQSKECNYNEAVALVGDHLGLNRSKTYQSITKIKEINLIGENKKSRSVFSTKEQTIPAKQSKETLRYQHIDADKSRLDNSLKEIRHQSFLEHKHIKDPLVKQAIIDFDNAIPLTDNKSLPLRRYLKKQGLVLDLITGFEDLRFSPNSRYYYDTKFETVPEKLQSMKHPYVEIPAMVAAFRDHDGKIINVYRTFLTPKSGATANLDYFKQFVPGTELYSSNNGAIRFGSPENGVLGIAMDIESAMSCCLALGIVCWASCGYHQMASFTPPKNINLVLIFSDKDNLKLSLSAAQKLESKLKSQGLPVLIIQPASPLKKKVKPKLKEAGTEDLKSLTWHQVYRQYGRFAYPYKESILSHFTIRTSQKIAC